MRGGRHDHRGDGEHKTVPFNIVPPGPDACQVCGRRPNHDPAQPHDAQSLYYQYAFYALHNRWPTWRDAVAHCADNVKAQWEKHLRALGAWPEDGEGASDDPINLQGSGPAPIVPRGQL